MPDLLTGYVCTEGGPQDKGYRRKILTKPEMQIVARQKQAATAIPHVSEGINEGRKKNRKILQVSAWSAVGDCSWISTSLAHMGGHRHMAQCAPKVNP